MEDRALQEMSLNLTPDDIPCSSVGNSEDVAKILAQMQETKPTRFKKGSRRKVSSIFCFAPCFLAGHVRCVPGSKTYLLASCIPF